MKFYIFSFLAVILAMTSCKNISDLDGIEVSSSDAEFAVPLVTAEFTLQGLLDNFGDLALITIEPDGCIRLTYEGEVLRAGAEVITSAINDVLPLGFPIPITENEVVLPFSIPDEYEFDFIRLKAGGLIYSFRGIGEPIDFTMTFPNFLLDDAPVVINRSTSSSELITNAFSIFDMEGAVIAPNADGTLTVEYTAINSAGESILLEDVNFIITDNLQFDYLEGYLGETVFNSEPGEIVIDLFDEFIRGEIWFQDPTITMTIDNSYGMPVSSQSEYFEVITTNGEILPLRSDELGPDLQIFFNYPTLDEVGESKQTVYTFNKENSNIDSILGSGPTIIRYDVNALPNPNQDTETRGFISCESEYVVKIKADLPIYGRANNFGAQDTLDLNFDGYDDIKNAEFKIVTENALPLDIGMQLYFADASNNIIDSLFTQMTTIIASPEVDADGLSIGSSREEFFVNVNAERFRKLANDSEKIFVSTSFSTTDSGEVPVKVLAEQKVQIRMGVKLVRN